MSLLRSFFILWLMNYKDVAPTALSLRGKNARQGWEREIKSELLNDITHMTISSSPALRFREFRERAGLTHEEVANSLLISASCIWDIESNDGELSSCYSPSDVQKLCQVLNIRPIELFGGETTGSPISAIELVRLIHEQCHSRGVTLEQFEDKVGWRLSACIEPPEHLLEDITIDGLQWLCRELSLDWRRIILNLG